MKIMTNDNDDDDKDYKYDDNIDYSGVDNNNCYEDNYKITNRLRKTIYISGPVNHDHKLKMKNTWLYELN